MSLTSKPECHRNFNLLKTRIIVIINVLQLDFHNFTGPVSTNH